MTNQMIKAGIVQFDIRVGDVEVNVARAKRRISNLARKGVDLVLLPEMWSTGFANDRLEELSETTPRVLDELIRLSKDMHLTIIGSLPEKGADGVYNTAYVVDRDGSVLESYRKVHLFSLTREDEFFKPGRKAVVAKTSLGKVGLMVCYDLRFPELCRSLTLQGAKIVAVMAQWPASRVAHWKALLKARAIENQVFVMGANRCGEDYELSYGGHSRIISPWGEVMARTGKGPASVSAPIDVGFVDSTREQIPCLQDRKPQAYV